MLSSFWIPNIVHLEEMRTLAAGQGLPEPALLKGCKVILAYRARTGEQKAYIEAALDEFIERMTKLGATVAAREAKLLDEEELAGRIEEASENLRSAQGSAVTEWTSALECFREEATAFMDERGGSNAEPFTILKSALLQAAAALKT